MKNKQLIVSNSKMELLIKNVTADRHL